MNRETRCLRALRQESGRVASKDRLRERQREVFEMEAYRSVVSVGFHRCVSVPVPTATMLGNGRVTGAVSQTGFWLTD